ncbi:MAG: type II secretion system protein, partial [Pseudomonadota bacterium]
MKQKQSGFSLLEAIVALVIVATVGASLLSWINTNLISLNRVQAAQQRNTAIQNALAYIDTVNLTAAPQGNETLGIYTFQWQSTLVEPARTGTDNMGGPGIYELSLYNVVVVVLEIGLVVVVRVGLLVDTGEVVLVVVV